TAPSAALVVILLPSLLLPSSANHPYLPSFPTRRSSDLKREQFSGFNRTLDAINNVFRKFSAFHDETGRLKPLNCSRLRFSRNAEIGRAVQQECRDRSRMPSSAWKKKITARSRRISSCSMAPPR